MSDERTWKCMVGVLSGLGECVWDESFNEIRRVTGIFAGSDGQVGIGKRLIGGALKGLEIIKADGLVAFSVDAPPDLVEAHTRLWSGSIIQPANGSRMPKDWKLDK